MRILLHLLCFSLLLACVNAADNKRDKVVTKREQRDGPDSLKADDTTKIYRSQFFRKSQAEILSYAQVREKIQNGNLETYRFIPNDFDNDERATRHTYELNECGVKPDVETVKGRRADCLAKNPDGHLWDGEKKGISGEGRWSLIVKSNTEPKHTVWLDETTGMLWTSLLGDGDWEQASGQNINDSKNFLCSTISIIPANEVKWYLPSRNEFLQADLNGARFVLPDLDQKYWTSTKVHSGNSAWYIIQKTGELKEASTEETLDIRCVGFPIK